MPNPNINRRVVLRSAGVPFPGIELGTIFTDQFARASLGTNYTADGVVAWTTDGAKLITSSGTGVFTDRLRRSFNPTCLERHSITVDFKQTSAIGATSYGIAIGVFSSNNNDRRSYAIQVQTSSGANLGKSYLRISTGAGAPAYTIEKTSTGSVVVNQNDSLRVVVTRTQNAVAWTVYNLTLGTSYSESHTFSLAYAAGAKVPHGGGQFVLHALGGVLHITDWNVTSLDKKNVKPLFIGDSITYGLFSSTIADRWADEVMAGSVNSYTVSGGPSDKTAEVLERINELILINPRYAVLMIGGNDVQFGIAAGTRNANYLSIVNQLKAAGITVVHCYATPRDAYDMTAWNAHILATYGGTDVVIDTFTPLADSGLTTLAAAYDSTDGVHPNAAGHALVASTILTASPDLV